MFHSIDDQTIIAQCTPRGSGALALLRISGINAIEIANKIAKLSGNKSLNNMPSHTIHYGSIVEADGALVDQVMFLLMRAPRTFTGQDTVEITCHNNQFIIDRIIAVAITHGARLAQEGEFTKRAVLHGKIDIVQAEAINELIHAQTQMALKQSLSQLSGSFSAWIANLEKELLTALALCQASFEFLDDEMEFGDQINAIIIATLASIDTIKKTFNQQQQIRQGVRVAIIGSVNAGKSSLFNALLNQQRAIVTAIAGTTRDSIEAGLYKNGNFWTLVDTAGLRETNDVIEQEGIRRSFNEAHLADIILLTFDATRSITSEEEKVYQEIAQKYENKIIRVISKVDDPSIRSSGTTQDVYINENFDAYYNNSVQNYENTNFPLHISSRRSLGSLGWLGSKRTLPLILRSIEDASRRVADRLSAHAMGVSKDAYIAVSSKTKKNIGTLEMLIEQKIKNLFDAIESPFLLNQRQHNLLLAFEKKVTTIKLMLDEKNIAYELLAIHLNDAIAHLAELSGKEISEAIWI